jgi:hypothetical protein
VRAIHGGFRYFRVEPSVELRTDRPKVMIFAVQQLRRLLGRDRRHTVGITMKTDAGFRGL